MINHRIRGLAAFHKLSLLCVTFAWFWVVHYLWEATGRELINLPWNYALVAAVGVLVASFGSFQEYGAFLRSGLAPFCWFRDEANFQCGLLAFFVQAYFATKDKEISRLFLGTFIGSCWPVLVSQHAFPDTVVNPSVQAEIVIIGDGKSLDALGN